MLRIWVLTVFTDTDSSAAISGRDRLVGRVSQYLELAGAELFYLLWCRRVFGPHGCAAHDAEDVGEQRGVCCLMPRQRFEQLPVGQPGQQVSLHDPDASDDRRGAAQYLLHCGERPGRITVRQADHRASIADLGRLGPLVIQRRQRDARLIGNPETGLGG
jgi:hypothetical protein